MAIIYSYPGKSPVAANDTVVITDSSTTTQAASATKSATMSTIANYVINSSGYPITLQRVLNDGATATPENQAWGGRISLTNGTSGDEVEFSIASSSGAPPNRFLFSTDNGLSHQLQVTGGVQVTAENGNTVTITKAAGNLTVDGRFSAGGASDFLSALTVNGILTLYDDLDFNGNGGINLDTGDINKTAAGFLTIQANGGIRLNANNGSNPTITMGGGVNGGVDILSAGSGNILISPENTGTGDITIGNGNSGGEIIIETASNLDIDADTGITIDNVVSGDLLIKNSSTTGKLNLQAFNDVSIASTGHDIVITTNNDDKDITINAGDNLDLNAKAPGIYVNVRINRPGTIAEGRAVYVVDRINGYIEVEECDADNPSTMPAFGIVTEPVTGSEGKVITNGVHKFTSGSIVTGGDANDPLYVAGATSSGGATTPGTLILTRPTSRYAPLATSTYPDLQVVARLIDTANPDQLFVNCVGFQAPEIIRGQFDVELWDGASGTEIAQNSLAKGYYEINNSIVSGFFKINPSATRALLNNLYVKFRLPGTPATYLHDNNIYPPNSNLIGTALCVTSAVADPPANANVGSISGVDGYLLKQLLPAAGYQIIGSGATITSGDVYEFSFSYYTDK